MVSVAAGMVSDACGMLQVEECNKEIDKKKKGWKGLMLCEKENSYENRKRKPAFKKVRNNNYKFT